MSTCPSKGLCTALMWNHEFSVSTACELQNVNMVNLLLSHNASVNQRCGQGWTALHEAVSKDNTEICEILIQAGATINPANTYSITPLIVAAQRGQMRALRYLIDKGSFSFCCFVGVLFLQKTHSDATDSILNHLNWCCFFQMQMWTCKHVMGSQLCMKPVRMDTRKLLLYSSLKTQMPTNLITPGCCLYILLPSMDTMSESAYFFEHRNTKQGFYKAT